MILNDRGAIVWLQLLPPVLMMSLAAFAVILLDQLGRGDGPMTTVALVLMALAALWLFRIGLAQWHLRE